MRAYGFVIGQLPHPLFHPKQAKKALSMLKELEGLKGLHQHQRGATMLFFDELNQAKRARNVVRGTGNAVGTYIMECDRNEDWTEIHVLRPADQ